MKKQVVTLNSIKEYLSNWEKYLGVPVDFPDPTYHFVVQKLTPKGSKYRFYIYKREDEYVTGFEAEGKSNMEAFLRENIPDFVTNVFAYAFGKMPC